MRKTALIFIILICALSSCTKKNDIFDMHDYFSFLTRTMNVPINNESKLLVVKGKLTKSSESFSINYIVVDEKFTTAIRGQHYDFEDFVDGVAIIKNSMNMFFPANTKDSQVEIKLIPENITEPLDLVLYHSVFQPIKDYTTHIDTITVKLIPTLK